MAIADFYELLGIPKTASIEDIKQAYRKKAKETHPDVGGNEDDFKRIKEAFDVLSNPQSKNEYDYFYSKYKGYKTRVEYQESQEQPPTKKQEKPIFDENNSSPLDDELLDDEKLSKPFIIFHWRAFIMVAGSIIMALIIVGPIQKSFSLTKPVFIPSSTYDKPKTEQAIVEPTSSIPILNVDKTAKAVQIPVDGSTGTAKPADKPIKKPEKEESPKFTLDSSKDEVRSVMGEPDSIEKYPPLGDVWRYGLSSVNFNTQGKVNGWSSIKNGKASIGEKKSDNATFTLSSTKQEVIDALGTPDSIEKYPPLGDVWRYGLSSVNFNTQGKVNGWSGMSSNKKAYLGDKKADASPIKEGSSKKDVIDNFGTPDSVETYPPLGDVWRYGLSSVNFDTDGKVNGWSNIKQK